MVHTREAIKNFRQIGGFSASSRFLCRKMLSGIDFSKDLTILELGAGNGIITHEILKQMSRDSEIHIYENHPSFVEVLQNINDSRLTIKDDCVSGISSCDPSTFDVVISSLPMAIFTKHFKHDIYNNIKNSLKSPGTFIQYQYSLLEYKELEKNFPNCKIEFCLFNFPPAFIYKMQYEDDALIPRCRRFRVA